MPHTRGGLHMLAFYCFFCFFFGAYRGGYTEEEEHGCWCVFRLQVWLEGGGGSSKWGGVLKRYTCMPR